MLSWVRSHVTRSRRGCRPWHLSHPIIPGEAILRPINDAAIGCCQAPAPFLSEPPHAMPWASRHKWLAPCHHDFWFVADPQELVLPHSLWYQLCMPMFPLNACSSRCSFEMDLYVYNTLLCHDDSASAGFQPCNHFGAAVSQYHPLAGRNLLYGWAYPPPPHARWSFWCESRFSDDLTYKHPPLLLAQWFQCCVDLVGVSLAQSGWRDAALVSHPLNKVSGTSI